MSKDCSDAGRELRALKQVRNMLTAQQYRTIKGQILAGDIDGASKGIAKILRREART